MRVVGLPHRSGVLFLAFAALALGLTACSSGGSRPSNNRYDSRTGVSASARLIPPGASVPKGGGHYKLGAPYKVSGRWYIPREEPNYDQTGIASWYGSDFHGRATANGEIYDMAGLTAAHPTLPLPSYAYVTNLENGRTILVRINDRGPYANDRVIDLSREVARQLDSEGRGLARVRVRYAGRAPMNGDDRHERTYLASQPWFGGAGGRRLAEHSGSYLRQW
jgi:rare lipoprotein A